MSKKVELIIEVLEDGTINVTPSGTVGKECLELMAFLDKIEGFHVLETVLNDDYQSKQKTSLKNKEINRNNPH